MYNQIEEVMLMYCPNCGNYAESNFCPNCGVDLRNIVISKSISKADTDDYNAYLRFYPNKIEAIQALRIDTGMNAVEAKQIIDKLFGSDAMPSKPIFKHSSEWKVASAANNVHHKDMIEVDVPHYANRYYPDKAKAISALIQLGVGGVDARKAMDDAFLEITNSKKQAKANNRQKTAQKAVKTAGKGVGIAAFTAGALGFRVISNLTKMYTKKRR